MAKKAYIGVDGVARKIKKGYIGVDGVARRIKKAYIGIGGVARPCWSGGQLAYYGLVGSSNPVYTNMAASQTSAHAIFAGGHYYDYQTVTTKYSRRVDMWNKSLTHTYNEGGLMLGRSEMVATSVGNNGVAGSYALFAGGTNGSITTTVDRVDTAGTVLLAASLKTSRREMAATSTGIALFGGGHTGMTSNSLTTVDVYLPDLTKFPAEPFSLSVARCALAAASINNYAVFAGGLNGTTTVDIFDTNGLTRLSGAPLTTGRYKHVGVTVGKYMLFAGGNNGAYLDTVEVYDSSFTHLTSTVLCQARLAPTATTVDGYAIICGGGQSDYNRADVYDESLTHTTMLMTGGVTYAACKVSATIGDFALFNGGESDAYAFTVR